MKVKKKSIIFSPKCENMNIGEFFFSFFGDKISNKMCNGDISEKIINISGDNKSNKMCNAYISEIIITFFGDNISKISHFRPYHPLH